MRVVLTREAGKNDELLTWTTGEDVHEVPLTATTYFPFDAVQTELETLLADHEATSLLITSPRAVAYVQGLNAEPRIIEFASVGPQTTAALAAVGINATLVGTGPAAELANLLRGPSVVRVGATSMRQEIRAALAARDVMLIDVACYETTPRELDDDEREVVRCADVVFVGAPSAWQQVTATVSPATWILVPGETTRAVVAKTHHRVLVAWGENWRDLLRAGQESEED